MLFGHNSNVKAGEATYHVQTEDRGIAHGLIDTTVYSQGRVLHRRTHDYFDLLPLTPETEKALKFRVDDQHRTVIQEIMTGSLKFVPEGADLSRALENLSSAKIEAQAPAPRNLVLELANRTSWLAGKRIKLDVSVKDKENGLPVGKALVTAEIAGAVPGKKFEEQSSPDGRVLLEFEMPQLGPGPAELVIEAVFGRAKSQLRFQLKAKAKLPEAR